jgi:hypothetical protein
MRRAARGARCAVFLALAALAGCGGTSSETTDGGSIFVAFAADFAGFSTWEKVQFESGAMKDATHVAGKRTVYINRKPPAGATSFPLGTVIVKVTDADGKIFARAKRSATFNPKGAVGWEWFELLETAQHDVVIKWRGVGPPIGETYGGDPNAGCNLCHKGAPASDNVLTPGLGLELGGWDGGGVDGVTTSDAGEDGASPDAGTDNGSKDPNDADTTHE